MTTVRPNTTWKTTWNKTLYDYEKVINDINNGTHNKVIVQSKGKRNMKFCPIIGDFVYVSCNKLKIMKCVVISEFSVNMTQLEDPYNKGENRTHTENNICLTMRVIEVYNQAEPLKGNQSTWVKM